MRSRSKRQPPAGTRDIEQPERWLAGLDGAAAGSDRDLLAVLADLKPLVGDPAWTVNSGRVLEAVLRTQVGKLVPEDRSKFLEGYEDGQDLAARVEGEDDSVTIVVLPFREPAQASLFASIERRATATQKGEIAPGIEIVSDAPLTDGAGLDGKVEGFRLRREPMPRWPCPCCARSRSASASSSAWAWAT